MANRGRNKISMGVSTDNSSLDSLSFASFISIHEQQKKPPPSVAKQDTDFEFCSVTLNSTKAGHQLRHHQANIRRSNGQLLLQEFVFQSKQQQVASPIRSGAPLQDMLGNGKSSYCMDKDREKHPRRADQKERSSANTNNRSSRSGFGQKMLLSFISPCRECHATSPAVKTKAKLGE